MGQRGRKTNQEGKIENRRSNLYIGLFFKGNNPSIDPSLGTYGGYGVQHVGQ